MFQLHLQMHTRTREVVGRGRGNAIRAMNYLYTLD